MIEAVAVIAAVALVALLVKIARRVQEPDVPTEAAPVVSEPAPPKHFRPTHVDVFYEHEEGDLWTGRCECGFRSLHHSAKSDAEQRMYLHKREHRFGEPMTPITGA